MNLLPGQCRVYWADPADEQPWHQELLSAGERARRESLRRPEDRARQTVAAALLRLLVGRHLGEKPAGVRVERACTTCAVPHGRPPCRAARTCPCRTRATASPSC
ncbi:4'-phosphopantetheinyl transferase family protein [Catellatospora coxensis]